MRKWPPLRFFAAAARDRHFPRITVFVCFLTSSPKETLRYWSNPALKHVDQICGQRDGATRID